MKRILVCLLSVGVFLLGGCQVDEGGNKFFSFSDGGRMENLLVENPLVVASLDLQSEQVMRNLKGIEGKFSKEIADSFKGGFKEGFVGSSGEVAFSEFEKFIGQKSRVVVSVGLRGDLADYSVVLEFEDGGFAEMVMENLKTGVTEILQTEGVEVLKNVSGENVNFAVRKDRVVLITNSQAVIDGWFGKRSLDGRDVEVYRKLIGGVSGQDLLYIGVNPQEVGAFFALIKKNGDATANVDGKRAFAYLENSGFLDEIKKLERINYALKVNKDSFVIEFVTKGEFVKRKRNRDLAGLIPGREVLMYFQIAQVAEGFKALMELGDSQQVVDGFESSGYGKLVEKNMAVVIGFRDEIAPNFGVYSDVEGGEVKANELIGQIDLLVNTWLDGEKVNRQLPVSFVKGANGRGGYRVSLEMDEFMGLAGQKIAEFEGKKLVGEYGVENGLMYFEVGLDIPSVGKLADGRVWKDVVGENLGRGNEIMVVDFEGLMKFGGNLVRVGVRNGLLAQGMMVEVDEALKSLMPVKKLYYVSFEEGDLVGGRMVLEIK